MTRKRIALHLFLLLPLTGMAQFKTDVGQMLSQPFELSGNLRVDLYRLNESALLRDSLVSNPAASNVKEKSPILAGVLSAAVPGAGEYYTESYWKSVAFVGVEVAMWVTYAIYNGKGDRQTDLFQQFADDHWSVVRYADWIEQNIGQLNPDASGCSGIVTNSNPNVPPWERVDWNRLNNCEEQVGARTGNGFTHRLPPRPDQQYYELIGKYPQYAAGWDDGTNITPGDIVRSNVPKNFLDYSLMRGKANDLYNIASTAASVLVANHILSALDAAWSATRFNKSVKMSARLQPTRRPYGFVEFVPTATATITF